MIQKLFFLITLSLPVIGNAERLWVYVSVLPLKTFVEKIGGDHVDVRPMIQPGQSPATYDPTPRQISALANSALYIRAGVPFEKVWMERIRSVNPIMRVLDARAGIDLRIIEMHEDDHENEHPPFNPHVDVHQSGSERDPHVWTSPPLVKRMTGNIRDALTELDPANGQDYALNFNAYAAELDRLDRDIRARLKGVPIRKFMVFHPAWGYFADTYGLTQVPIEKEGKEPGARRLTALIEQAKREHVRVIFVQPQFNKKSAQQVARAIGGRVIVIDPLSPAYADNLRNLARHIAEAQK